jgi:predicted Zn-dependent peptidase
LGSYELLGGDYRTLSGYVSRIQGIKADEVSACVKRWLNRDNAVVIIARPFQAAAIRDEVLKKSGAL